VFDDGATASGFFIYDADFSTYDIVSISIGAGPLNAPVTFSFSNALSTATRPIVGVVFPDSNNTGRQALAFSLTSELTNAGGQLDLDLSVDNLTGFCTDFACNTVFASTARHLISGSVSAPVVSQVPVPAAAWLFGSGLIGLIGVARKKAV
jgi:hypothetical protein